MGVEAVEDGDGRDGEAAHVETCAVQLLERELGDVGAALLGVEGVGEAAVDGGECGLGAVDGDGVFAFELEGANVVEAHHVVGVGVGVENGVEAADAGAEGLGAEVGSGIDEDVAAVVGDEDGGAEAIVAGVGGSADVAVATDGGHAYAGAGAEDSDRERLSHLGFLGRGFGFLVGGLDEAEAEFGERVFEQALLFDGEVALGLFDEDGEGIDVMARDGKVALGLLFAFVDGHESEEHLGLGAERNDQKSKRRRGEWEGRLGFGDFGFAHADILTRGIE